MKLLSKPATRWIRLISVSMVVGVMGGVSAIALEKLLHFGVHGLVGKFTHLNDINIMQFQIMVIFLPAFGGLFSGLLTLVLGKNSRGHGTDLLTYAFHQQFGVFSIRGPAIKALAAVGVISTGGSAGPEGPIAALGASIGSSMGKLFKLSPHERRILLVAGCAAGVGSIFRCPLGGALFATGILYSEPEFETDAMVPSFIASVIGYTTFIQGLGITEPLLAGTSNLQFESAIELIPYGLLGPLCGLFAIFFSVNLRFIESITSKITVVPIWMIPAIGGILTGLIACMFPQVMDGQYVFINNAISLDWAGSSADYIVTWRLVGLFGAVALLKCVATSFTLGSGASGGVLGPNLFIGGVVGAFFGALCEMLFPDLFPASLRQSLIPVGMAGVLAATMRSPIASIVMVTEMTGSYGLIVPLMLVCITSYVIGRRFGMNHEQVRTAAESPAHASDAIIHILETNAGSKCYG